MTFQENVELSLRLIPQEILNTLYMVLGSSFFAFLIGIPLGIILSLTDQNGLKENSMVYRLSGFLINIGRSLPFAILMIALIPFTRLVVGTSIGTWAAIVPLTIAGAPFFARIVELALKEVDRGVIEASLVMGAKPLEIVRKVLFPEALPSLIKGGSLTMVNLIGLSAMAGLVGGGGLGAVAIQYGYQRFNGFIMVLVLVILLLFVEIVQFTGHLLAKNLSEKRGQR